MCTVLGGIDTRNIPIHLIFNKLGENISRMVLKSYIQTGCGMASKVGTKAAALKASPERFLQGFEEYDVTDTIFHKAEKYLLNVIRFKTKCEIFDALGQWILSLNFCHGS